MQRRTFLMGVLGTFASLAAGSLPTAAAEQAPEGGGAPAPNLPPESVSASDLDEREVDYMRRRRRRRRRGRYRMRRRYGRRRWSRRARYRGYDRRRRRSRRAIRSGGLGPQRAPAPRPAAPASRPALRFQ